MIDRGWFRINRRIFENEIWFAEPFTKAQAWIDLIGNANHKEGSFFIRGNEVKVKRGQIGWSELTMAKRWLWGRNRVRGFLKWLENRQQIEQQKSTITTLITIINYEKYQTDNTETIQQTIQQTDSRRNTNKNDKNVENTTKQIKEKELPTDPNVYALKDSSSQPLTTKGLPKDFFDKALDLAEKLSAKKVEEERRSK